jgi:predicted MFS family arabinose efflux permease
MSPSWSQPRRRTNSVASHGPTLDASEPLTSGDAAGHPLLSSRNKLWLVAVLLAVSTLNFADRAVLAVLAEPIKQDLKLTDSEVGMLQGLGFAILYSLLGLPLGWLAERVSRKRLIAVCVAVWSLTSAACGLASSFAGMLLGRIGVGVGEAGFQPAAYSLLADHFKADRRGSVLGIITLGAPFGFLFGQSVGGLVAANWGWRAAFFAVSAPGLIVALVVWLSLREPPRGLADGGRTVDAPPPLKAVLQELWSKRAVRHLLVGFTLASFGMTAVAQFVLPFYLRGFGLPIAVAGAAFGTVAFTSNGLGMLVGGFGGDHLARRDPRWAMWAPAAVLVLAAPGYLAAFASAGPWQSMALIWVANLLLTCHLAPTLSTVQNLVGPRTRAFAAAVFGVAAGLIGGGLGPTLLGVASDLFASHHFHGADFIAACPGGRAAAGAAAGLDAACRQASTHGLRDALMSVQVVFVWAALHYLFAARTLRQDLYAAP